MDGDSKRFDDLLKAASALVFARQADDDTCEEWDDMHRAILAAVESAGDVVPATCVFRDGYLVRIATLADGRVEEHACGMEDFEQVAMAVAEREDTWFVVDEVAVDSGRDWITAHIAVEFMRGYGLVGEDGTANRLRAMDGFSSAAAVAEFAVAEMRARGA